MLRAALLLPLLAACEPDPGEVTGDPDAGADVFAAACSSCHGPSGEGDIGPALAEVVPGMTEADVREVVTTGTGDMPAISLTEQETADVAAYVVETFGG